MLYGNIDWRLYLWLSGSNQPTPRERGPLLFNKHIFLYKQLLKFYPEEPILIICRNLLNWKTPVTITPPELNHNIIQFLLNTFLPPGPQSSRSVVTGTWTYSCLICCVIDIVATSNIGSWIRVWPTLTCTVSVDKTCVVTTQKKTKTGVVIFKCIFFVLWHQSPMCRGCSKSKENIFPQAVHSALVEVKCSWANDVDTCPVCLCGS